jgi:hypothetical protein
VEYLNHVGLGHIPRLTRVEWGVIRRYVLFSNPVKHIIATFMECKLKKLFLYTVLLADLEGFLNVFYMKKEKNSSSIENL